MTTMASGIVIAEIASLMGDVARANILMALMDGRALTASELAFQAGVGAATTSGHLAKLVEGNLVTVEKQGRHRYHRLAGQDVARAIEALCILSAQGPKRHRPTGPKDEALRAARTCYDHLAGRLGVQIADSLCASGRLVLSDGVGQVTDEGRRFLCEFGIDLDTITPSRRPLCRTCLDWSERRPHLAGRLAAAILDRCLSLNWVARVPESRAIRVTPAGQREIAELFRVEALQRVG